MSAFPNTDLHREGTPLRSSSNYILMGRLRPWWKVVIFLAPLVVGSAWLAYETRRVALATDQLGSILVGDVQGALSRDPENPDLIHRLGMLYSYDPTNLNLSESLKYLRRAALLNPGRWEFWSDLAGTCDFVGDTACSDEAFERARALNPITPSLLWTIGNHYLLTNRQDQAFSYFRRLLELTPEYRAATFALCLRATRDPQVIFAQVIPHGKDASIRFAFLEFLNTDADYENSLRIWEQMISGPDPSPDLASVKPFLDFLIAKNQMQAASTVWGELQHAGLIPPAPVSVAGNLLRDGRFAAPPLNLGFAWHTSDSPDLILDFSDPTAHAGGKCLRIEFPVGQNGNYDLLSQVVLIQPNTWYELSAYVRSENLTSDSGPRLRVEEMGCGDCEVRTSQPTLGTTSWHPVHVRFLTHPQTQAVRVSFWRPPGKMPPREILGTVWLDDVSLRSAEAAGSDVAQGRPR